MWKSKMEDIKRLIGDGKKVCLRMLFTLRFQSTLKGYLIIANFSTENTPSET